MQDNIRDIEDYIKEQKAKIAKIEKAQEELNLAKKNGFENYQDYEYATNREYSVNPKMQFNKKSLESCNKYLLKTLKTFLQYKLNGNSQSIDKNGNKFVLTVYSMNELVAAINRNEEAVINVLDENNLSINDFLRLVYTTELTKVSENKLGIKRG